jgi:hypothetical protein
LYYYIFAEIYLLFTLSTYIVLPPRDQNNTLPLSVERISRGDGGRKATKSTPAKLFLGRELNHPLQLQWKLSCVGHSSARELKEIWRDAMLSLREAKRKVAARYNGDRRPHSFQVADWVLVRLFPQSSAKDTISAKLLYKWSKPVVISKFLSPVTVELSFPHSGIRYRKAHISHLKLSNTQQDAE